VCDAPDLKYVNRFIKDHVCSTAYKWWDLGIELLSSDLSHKLNVIKTNGGNNATVCFNEMIKLWLQSQPNACWKQLIEAFTCLKLNTLAATIECSLLQTTDQGDNVIVSFMFQKAVSLIAESLTYHENCLIIGK